MLHIILHLHRTIIVNMETQHILIADSIDDGIYVQGFGRLSLIIRLTTKQLGCGAVLTTFVGIDRKDGCTRESKHHVAFHAPCNQLVHLTELTPMAFIENQYDILFSQHFAQTFVVVIDLWLHQVRQLLNSGNDDIHIVVLHLFQ